MATMNCIKDAKFCIKIHEDHAQYSKARILVAIKVKLIFKIQGCLIFVCLETNILINWTLIFREVSYESAHV